jgi:hypothetical protein
VSAREIASVVNEARRQAKQTGLSPEWILATNFVRCFPGTSMGFIRHQPEIVQEAKERPAPIGVEVDAK